MKFLRFKLTPQQRFDLSYWAMIFLIVFICLLLWLGTKALNDHGAFR